MDKKAKLCIEVHNSEFPLEFSHEDLYVHYLLLCSVTSYDQLSP